MATNMDVDKALKRSRSIGPDPPVKRARITLDPEQWIKFNTLMNKELETWKVLAPHAEKSPDISVNLFSLVLIHFGLVLRSISTHSNLQELNLSMAKTIIQTLSNAELKDWQHRIANGLRQGTWEGLVDHPAIAVILKTDIPDSFPQHQKTAMQSELKAAYRTDYYGDAVEHFIKHLETLSEKTLYAQAISIVQSSGTGKSRLLTEAGRKVFTLPICLRDERDPGYPIGDLPVVEFFRELFNKNDLSYSTHVRISSFIAAAHRNMLRYLKSWSSENKELDGGQLRNMWHGQMEVRDHCQEFRDKFFKEVLDEANSLYNQMTKESKKSPFDPASNAEKPELHAGRSYGQFAKQATKDLMDFISHLFPGEQPICITYLDEAHNLGRSIWVLAQLLNCQYEHSRMWFVFMGTKANISYFVPKLSDHSSARLKEELFGLPQPYLALGFDHHIRAKPEIVPSRFSEIQSMDHLSRYGRPLWKAQYLPAKPDALLADAKMKLTCGNAMNFKDQNHVFVVLSQRLCLDPIMPHSEAIKLAKTSVANHMRLLTAVSPMESFSTSSPSEPVLALAAAELLYATPHQWTTVLNTFSEKLCAAGLVDKGLLGELAARTLLLIARDFAAPKISIGSGIPDLLQPVLLLKVIDKLLGDKWVNRKEFEKGFTDAYVNFTHWMVTKDPLPEEPDLNLLANLWARGVALQCCFHQESLDCLIPVYIGSIEPKDEFNPKLFSVVVIQVKYRMKADFKAESDLRPFMVPRDSLEALPYLALVLEFGVDKECIKSTLPPSMTGEEFDDLQNELYLAKEKLARYMEKPSHAQKRVQTLKKVVKAFKSEAEEHNRYSICVHGASPDIYNILKEAKIEDAFEIFLRVTMPQPLPQEKTMQWYHPLERIAPTSAHTDWLLDFSGKNGRHRERRKI